VDKNDLDEQFELELKKCKHQRKLEIDELIHQARKVFWKWIWFAPVISIVVWIYLLNNDKASIYEHMKFLFIQLFAPIVSGIMIEKYILKK
jgi:hypothetical protein